MVCVTPMVDPLRVGVICHGLDGVEAVDEVIVIYTGPKDFPVGRDLERPVLGITLIILLIAKSRNLVSSRIKQPSLRRSWMQSTCGFGSSNQKKGMNREMRVAVTSQGDDQGSISYYLHIR